MCSHERTEPLALIQTVVVVVAAVVRPLSLSVDVAARVLVCVSMSSPLTERERRDSVTISEDSDGFLFCLSSPQPARECSQSDR